MAARTPRNKHIKHQSLDRQRRSNFSDFVREQGIAKQVPERVVRDLFSIIGTKSPAEVEAAASAVLAGAVRTAITGTLAQIVPVSPGDLAYGGNLVGGQELRALRFGASSGAITVTFDATANTITRATGSFLTDGFVVGGRLAISGAVDAANNSSTPTIVTATALVLTLNDVAADEVDDAGVTLIQTNSIHDLQGRAFTGLAGTIGVGSALTISGAGTWNGTYLFVDEPSAGALIVTTAAPANPGFDATSGVASGALTVDFAAAGDTITRATGSFITDGFTVGSKVLISGAADAANNGVFGLAAVAALVLTLNRDVADEVADAGVTVVQLSTVSFASDTIDFGVTVDFALLAENLSIFKGVSDKTVLVNIDGTAETITRLSAGSFLDEGFEAGGVITISDSAQAGNNTVFTISAVTNTVITVTGDLTTSAGDEITISQAATIKAASEDLVADGFAIDAVIELSGSTHNDGIYTVVASSTNVLTVSPSPKQTEVLSSKGRLFARNVIVALTSTAFAALEGGAVLDISAAINGRFEVASNAIDLNTAVVVDTGASPGHGPFGPAAIRDQTGTAVIKLMNAVIRSAGDWSDDGFAGGQRIVISGAGVGIDGDYEIIADTEIGPILKPAFTTTLEPTALSTLIGVATLTRSAGDWAADGFSVGSLIALTGTQGAGSITSGSLTVDFAAAGTITRATGSFITDGFMAGDTVSISGAVDAGNNGVFTIKSVAALVLTLEQVLADEVGDTGVTITKGINDGIYRISYVISATAIELAATIVPEVATPTMVVWKINERVGRA